MNQGTDAQTTNPEGTIQLPESKERSSPVAKDQDKGIKNDKKKPAKNIKEKRAAKKEKAASHSER